MKLSYRTTIYGCFTGYIVQAVVNNFLPLLFLNLSSSYGLPLEHVTLLVTVNFCVQLLTDLVAAKYTDRIGIRQCMVLAHVLGAAGLILLGLLPQVLPPFAGILTAVCVYAVGGGLLEVLVSPVMESCPSDNKASAMSLLHSFYCWGHVGVVVISTLFFRLFGISSWPVLACLWAVVPAVNALLFLKTPIAPLIADGSEGMGIGKLLRTPTFWLLAVMMVCAGASEQAVSQWSSAFAEQGLGIGKTLGDLLGPMTFAICMGTARAVYGKLGERMPLRPFMVGSAGLCIAAYLLIALSPEPVLSVLGCAICGVSVGIMWPGTFSSAAAALPLGGSAMFALLALAGDLGCSAGPTLAGFISGLHGDDLHAGILAAICFPILMLFSLMVSGKGKKA